MIVSKEKGVKWQLKGFRRPLTPDVGYMLYIYIGSALCLSGTGFRPPASAIDRQLCGC